MDHYESGAKITLTTSEERKKRVIDLYNNQRKKTREIAKIERMSICDISIILKEEESKRLKYKIIIYVVLVSYCILDDTFLDERIFFLTVLFNSTCENKSRK
jgi:hypothetical protein